MTKDEMEEVSIQLDQDAEKSLNIAKRSLAWKVSIVKTLNKGAVKTILSKGWGDPEGMAISDLGANLYLITFSEDKKTRKNRGFLWTICLVYKCDCHKPCYKS